MPALERTLILLKPDCVQRGLIGRVLSRFEDKGLRIVGLQMRRFSRKLLEEHYAVHRERPFFSKLVAYMGSGPVVAIALEGLDAIEVTRGLIGATNSRKALPGTIRGDFGMSFSNNLVHGSDGKESAAKELGLFFGGEGEIVEWTPADLEWVYSAAEELA
jgi:nucleoside-diphosphate kinase